MDNQEILKLTNTEISECDCDICKQMCKTPCIGTPQDIINLIKAGHNDKLAPTSWSVGMHAGTHLLPVYMIAPRYDEQKKICSFNKNGLCILHECGLKPLEGKIAHHSRIGRSLHGSALLKIVEQWENLTFDQMVKLTFRENG